MANKKTRKRWTGYSIYGAETEKEYQSKLKKHRQWHGKDATLERKEKIGPILEKISLLITMIEKLDGNKIHTQWSSYKFVMSCQKQATTNLRLSEKQMSALNKTWHKYNERLEKKLNKEEQDGNNGSN